MAGYDMIGEDYLLFKQLLTAVLERSNTHTALAPYVKGTHVLDLSCGIGHYSTRLLGWGAKSVVGFGLSAAMVEVANKQSETLLVTQRSSGGVVRISISLSSKVLW
ncbi:hypothetical protein OQA88_4650 [Cercophora sp. LCS_1]